MSTFCHTTSFLHFFWIIFKINVAYSRLKNYKEYTDRLDIVSNLSEQFLLLDKVRTVLGDVFKMCSKSHYNDSLFLVQKTLFY